MRKLLLVLVLCMFVLVAQQTATRLWAQGEKKDAPPEPKFKVGEMAPDFKLLDQNRKEVKLSDYRGKKNVALAFYVFAFTGGWTKEMQAFQQNIQKLEAADTQVLGVSMDSTFSNAAWAEKIGVTFPLLSDWGGEVTQQYGIYNPQYKAARRVTFLIDKEGKIAEMHTDKDAVDPSAVVTSCERRKMKS